MTVAAEPIYLTRKESVARLRRDYEMSSARAYELIEQMNATLGLTTDPLYSVEEIERFEREDLPRIAPKIAKRRKA